MEINKFAIIDAREDGVALHSKGGKYLMAFSSFFSTPDERGAANSRIEGEELM